MDNVSMPTLVVCGDEDRDNGSAEALAELLPLIADRMSQILGWDASEHLRQRIDAEALLAADLAAIPLGA